MARRSSVAPDLELQAPTRAFQGRRKRPEGERESRARDLYAPLLRRSRRRIMALHVNINAGLTCMRGTTTAQGGMVWQQCLPMPCTLARPNRLVLKKVFPWCCWVKNKNKKNRPVLPRLRLSPSMGVRRRLDLRCALKTM